MKVFRFHFNLEYGRDLRNAVNDRQKQSIDNVHQDKQVKGDYYAWNRTCAAMDRLEDTLSYINGIELGKCENSRAAFDFYDFINNAYIVIDCIKTIGHIFRVDDNLFASIESSSAVFGKTLGETSTDARYFEYIRSLCVVHPLCTNHQKEFLDGGQFHCCPYVTWNSHLFSFKDGDADLTATVYTAKQRETPIRLGLFVSQFEEYLTKWIDLIPKIIEAKNEYTNQIYAKLKNAPVKNLSDYSNDVVRYLAYLKKEYCRRFDYGDDYLFQQYIRVFTIEVSDSRNKELLNKYRNAIIYSLQFERNALQAMSFDGYENTGIRYPDRGIETTLFDALWDISPYDSLFSKYAYNLGKIGYLEEDYYYYENKHYARSLLEAPKSLINQYVHFTNEETDSEATVLVSLALYLESLTRKSMLNRNIPNELAYRVNIMSNEQYSDIIAEESDTSEVLPKEDLQRLIEKYGGSLSCLN